MYFFSGTRLGRTRRWIFTVYGSYDVISNSFNISPIWGEAPAVRIEMKTCIGVDLLDVIMEFKFKFEKLLGF